MLEKTGHSLVLASTGDEALVLLAAEAFDVVILDLRLPGIHGLNILELSSMPLAANRCDCPATSCLNSRRTFPLIGAVSVSVNSLRLLMVHCLRSERVVIRPDSLVELVRGCAN